jgi:hypothetical protein
VGFGALVVGLDDDDLGAHKEVSGFVPLSSQFSRFRFFLFSFIYLCHIEQRERFEPSACRSRWSLVTMLSRFAYRSSIANFGMQKTRIVA